LAHLRVWLRIAWHALLHSWRFKFTQAREDEREAWAIVKAEIASEYPLNSNFAVFSLADFCTSVRDTESVSTKAAHAPPWAPLPLHRHQQTLRCYEESECRLTVTNRAKHSRTSQSLLRGPSLQTCRLEAHLISAVSETFPPRQQPALVAAMA
jgi:hypothetical protein